MLGGESDFEIVGQAENGDMAVELAEVLHPDIVLMDINMPNMDGITAIRIIAQRHPDVHVVGLSIYRAEERADEMIKAGAKAYVSKTALFRTRGGTPLAGAMRPRVVSPRNHWPVRQAVEMGVLV